MENVICASSYFGIYLQPVNKLEDGQLISSTYRELSAAPAVRITDAKVNTVEDFAVPDFVVKPNSTL
jgi:hypothetical protein